MSRPLLSAHQSGFEDGYAPNSLEAVIAVRDAGVDLIEFDVRVTKDNKFVTLHDETVQVNGTTIQVEETDARTILKHAKGACLLETMLKAIKDHAIAHVDLKDTHHEIEIVNMCESILGKRGFIITTLEDESVAKLRQARPDVQVALSLGRDVRNLAFSKRLAIRLSELFPAKRIVHCRPTMLALNYKIARAGVARWAVKHQLPVLLWTINTPTAMHKAWKNPYIWAFTTNKPRAALMELYSADHHQQITYSSAND